MEIRKPNLQDLNESKISQDFINSMNLFNTLLENGKLPYCPRKSPITEEEVKDLWMPSTDKNITCLAYDNGDLVASGTLLVAEDSNEYSKQTQRGLEYALTFNPEYPEAAKQVTQSVLEEAKQKGLEFITHVSIENEAENKIMQELGLKREEVDSKRYKEAGLNPSVYKYHS